MLLLWLSLSPSGWAGESEPAKEAKVIPKISLNVQQGPTGLSLAPALYATVIVVLAGVPVLLLSRDMARRPLSEVDGVPAAEPAARV